MLTVCVCLLSCMYRPSRLLLNVYVIVCLVVALLVRILSPSISPTLPFHSLFLFLILFPGLLLLLRLEERKSNPNKKARNSTHATNYNISTTHQQHHHQVNRSKKKYERDDRDTILIHIVCVFVCFTVLTVSERFVLHSPTLHTYNSNQLCDTSCHLITFVCL